MNALRQTLSRGILAFAFVTNLAHADFDVKEPNFYSMGMPTADSLRHKEWLLAPIPWGWVAYGATDRLTLAWDYPLAIVGFPAGLIRYQIPSDHETTRYALEGYALGFPKKLEDKRQDDYLVTHRGFQSWVRLNRTQDFGGGWRLHAYGGGNYKKEQTYSQRGDSRFVDKTYRKHWNPDAGIGLEWQARSWLKFHLNYTYGNTLLLYDQVAIKSMVAGGLHMAPFTDKKYWAILRNLRIELIALTVHVPDAHFKKSLPVPVYPYLYWQWGGSSK